MYKDLTIRQGTRFFLDSTTIVPYKNADFFPDFKNSKFDSKKVRQRCLFENGHNCCPTVYLYLTNEEVSIMKGHDKDIPKEIYLFGSSDETDVAQVRAFGKTKIAVNGEMVSIMAQFEERFKGEETTHDNLLGEISVEDKKNARDALSLEGILLIVEIISYSYLKSESE